MKELLQQIEEWNDHDEFSKCITAIEAIPEEERGFELTLLLGRAYSNLAVLGDHGVLADNDTVIDKEKLAIAVKLLESVREEGMNNAYWNCRMAYALWMTEGREREALQYAKNWLAMEPDNEDAHQLISDCESFLQQQSETFAKEVYTAQEKSIIEEHIGKYFGSSTLVLHENAGGNMDIDIYIVPPRCEHDYYTLVTCGMGAYKMQAENQPNAMVRAELLINVPKTWLFNKEALENEKYYWILRFLLKTVYLPVNNQLCFGWGYTIGSEEPLTEGADFAGAILLYPGIFGEQSYSCTLPNGEIVNFYQLIPLYQEEIEFKLEHGLDKLLEKCPDELLEVVDIERMNAVTDAAVLNYDDALMYDGKAELQLIHKYDLSLPDLAAYSYIAFYLRWSIERNLLSNPFYSKYRDIVEKVQHDKAYDLRGFIGSSEGLHGKLRLPCFGFEGTEFARWYSWGNRSKPYAYLKDLTVYAQQYLEQGDFSNDFAERYAYLFIPYDEKAYQDIAAILDRRFAAWEELPENRIPEKLLQARERAVKNYLPNWQGPRYCYASDRIIVDGCRIGYCFRSEPDSGDEGWNSGWYFLSGDESDDYLDNDDNFGLYDLNTVCNYDPAILILLDAPIGISFERCEDGSFKEYIGEGKNLH